MQDHEFNQNNHGAFNNADRQSRIAAGIAQVRSRIEAACAACGRSPAEITLVAVSKFMTAADVAAAMNAGQIDFGENYAQELCAKAASPELTGLAPRWHFLGGLQSRKVKDILPRVSSIHSVDRDSIVDELKKRAALLRPGADPLPVFIEINTGDESQKSGVAASDAERLCRIIMDVPEIRLEGLMCIPPFSDDPETSRPHFAMLRRLRDDLIDRIGPPPGVLFGLSMGMTADYPVAIEEGATVVRVGTAIFGSRPVSAQH